MCAEKGGARPRGTRRRTPEVLTAVSQLSLTSEDEEGREIQAELRGSTGRGPRLRCRRRHETELPDGFGPALRV